MTLEPSSSSKMRVSEVRGSLRLRHSMFLPAKMRASAVRILPEPIMAYLIQNLHSQRAPSIVEG
jgi:hypothetical protein